MLRQSETTHLYQGRTSIERASRLKLSHGGGTRIGLCQSFPPVPSARDQALCRTATWRLDKGCPRPPQRVPSSASLREHTSSNSYPGAIRRQARRIWSRSLGAFEKRLGLDPA